MTEEKLRSQPASDLVAAGYADYGSSWPRKLIAGSYFPFVMASCMAGVYYLHSRGVKAEYLPLFSGFYSAGLAILGERIQPHTKAWWPKAREDVGVDTLFAFVYGIPLQVVGKVAEMLLKYGLLFVGLNFSSGLGGGLWPTSIPFAAQFVLAVLIADFVTYWTHRFLHRSPWAWRFHSVHHSPKIVYWWNSPRHHLVDSLLVSLPSLSALILCGVPDLVLAFYGLFSIAQGYLQHSNIRLAFGPLNWIFSTNALHRWHHSKNRTDADSNYGGILIIWDLLFGTYHLPKDRLQRADDIGVGYEGYPRSFVGQTLIPFSWHKVEPEPEAAPLPAPAHDAI